MSADASRPQPTYGRYATPEEVARARGMTLEEYERHLASIALPAAREEATDAASAPLPAQPTPIVTPAQKGSQAPRTSSANRFVTVALLAFGLVSVLFSIPSLLGLGDGLAAAFEMQGLEPFTSYETARTVGVVAIIAQGLLWLLTLALSLSALRRGRLAWWIPLVAGVIAVILVSALMIGTMTGDPAFAQYIEELSLPA